MDEQAGQSAFISALGTEHFVLQSASSTTVAEAGTRASLYVLSLSSSLVAMGFAVQTPGAFMPLAATVLPAIFLLGLFTVLRLVDTSIEHYQFQTAIVRIRRYYRNLTPEAASYFPLWGGSDDDRAETMAASGVRHTLFIWFGTTASMVAAINSIVAGAGVALIATWLLGRDQTVLAVIFGIVGALISMSVFLIYQRRRFDEFEHAFFGRTGNG
jgi:hypothetical protein